MASSNEASRHLELVSSPRDPQIEQAVQLMQADLSERWTVTKLARSVGLSRPTFARRFVVDQGVSPLRYLSGARMDHAADLLRRTDWSLAQVAERVGYDSQFAFNRAFKRHHRQPPGVFRRQSRFAAPMLRAA